MEGQWHIRDPCVPLSFAVTDHIGYTDTRLLLRNRRHPVHSCSHELGWVAQKRVHDVDRFTGLYSADKAMHPLE